MSNEREPLKGRGATINPVNRFEPLHFEVDEDAHPPENGTIATQYFVDPSRSIISHNDSPDVDFETSVNPYRGCEHGCIYCFARPTHEFLGLSSGLDFETKIFVKSEAPRLLREELLSRRWKPQVIAMSGVTDCYQPIERKLQLTRGCLEVLAEFRNPVAIITKNQLVARDADVLSRLASHDGAVVFVSITTLDNEIARTMEPRASAPQLRLDAIRTLAAAGVPVGVLVAPIIPGLTDHEMPAILKAAREHGATTASYTILRLPFAVKDLFAHWLEEHFPDRKDKVLNRVRSMRDGKLNDPNFGSRMQGDGIFADQIRDLFHIAQRKLGLEKRSFALSAEHFQRPRGPQLDLF